MALRQDQAVAFGGRAGIEDDAEVVVFIERSRRDLASGEFAENTVRHGIPPFLTGEAGNC